MKTIEQLKSIGFTENNLIQINTPEFEYNNERLTVITIRIPYWHDDGKRIINEFNSCKLIAWFPCDDNPNDTSLYFRYKILER